MVLKLEALVNEFVQDGLDEADRIHKKSFENVIEDASIPVGEGGRMPVIEGNLRNSISVNGSSGETSYAIGIAAAPRGGDLDAIWDVPYATTVEFGRNGNPGRAFATGAVLKWPEFVAQNTRSG